MKNLFRKTSKGTTPKALKIKCTKETKKQVAMPRESTLRYGNGKVVVSKLISDLQVSVMNGFVLSTITTEI